MRTRVEYLESIILENENEKGFLREQLSELNRKLIIQSQIHCKSLRCWFNTIPDDILGKIFSYAEDKTLIIVASVNKQIYSYISNDNLWIPRFKKRWGKQRYMKERRDNGACWKQIFAENLIVDDNWQRQRSRAYELKAHNGTVTCLALYGNRMVSGSDDGSMALWDMSHGRMGPLSAGGRGGGSPLLPPPALPLAQLMGLGGRPGRYRTGLVRCGAGAGAELGSQQRQQTCPKLRTFHGHGGPVWCLEYDPGTERLFSGSYDQTIKVREGVCVCV